MTPEAIEAATEAYFEGIGDVSYQDAIRMALEAAAPYLIREARAAELEAAAESIYRQARVQLRSSDGSRWQLAHRSGYADGVILARQELRARAAAIRAVQEGN